MTTNTVDLNEALRYAAETGDLVRIKQFIADGAEIQTWDNAPLRRAIRHRRTEAARLLVQSGAPLKDYETEFINRAASNGDTETLKWLLSQIQNPINLETLDDALLVAIKSNKKDCVEVLLDRGADLHSENGTAWLTAASYGDFPMLQLLARRGADPCVKDSQALFSAVFSHSIECVRLVIATGADLKAQAGIPLELAINSGEAEIVEELFRAGMTMAEPDWVVSAAWKDSLETLLLLEEKVPQIIADKANDIAASAAAHAAPRVLSYILKHHRIAQNVVNDGLFASVQTPSYANIDVLLACGASPKTNNSAAFSLAVTRSELEIAKKLLLAGADAGVLNNESLAIVFKAADKRLTHEVFARGAIVKTTNLEPFNAVQFIRDISADKMFLDTAGKPLPPDIRQVRLHFAQRIAQGASDYPEGDSGAAVLWLADAIEAAED